MIKVIYEVSKALAQIICDENSSDQTKKLRFGAIQKIIPMMDAFFEEFHNLELVEKACAKRIEYIMTCTTKKDMDLIMSGPKVRYDGNKIQPAHPFVVPAEELMAWSRTSLVAPLDQAGLERYMKVFREIFPEMAEEILKES